MNTDDGKRTTSCGADPGGTSEHPSVDRSDGKTLTRRETLRQAGRLAYVAPTVMVFSMSTLQGRGPGSPPPPPGKTPSRDDPLP